LGRSSVLSAGHRNALRKRLQEAEEAATDRKPPRRAGAAAKASDREGPNADDPVRTGATPWKSGRAKQEFFPQLPGTGGRTQLKPRLERHMRPGGARPHKTFAPRHALGWIQARVSKSSKAPRPAEGKGMCHDAHGIAGTMPPGAKKIGTKRGEKRLENPALAAAKKKRRRRSSTPLCPPPPPNGFRGTAKMHSAGRNPSAFSRPFFFFFRT